MKELYELTNPQKSIWVTEEFYKGTSIENIAGTAVLSQEVNFDKLKEAINIFIQTNLILYFELILTKFVYL